MGVCFVSRMPRKWCCAACAGLKVSVLQGHISLIIPCLCDIMCTTCVVYCCYLGKIMAGLYISAHLHIGNIVTRDGV